MSSRPAEDLPTPHAPDDAPDERPKYVRGTPEYQAEWRRIYAARQQAQREKARLSHQARRAVRKPLPRPEPPEETPEQHSERMRFLAERHERKREEARQRAKAKAVRLNREAAS